MLTELVNAEWRTIDTYRAEQSLGSAPVKSGSWPTCQQQIEFRLFSRTTEPSPFRFLSTFPFLSFPFA